MTIGGGGSADTLYALALVITYEGTTDYELFDVQIVENACTVAFPSSINTSPTYRLGDAEIFVDVTATAVPLSSYGCNTLQYSYTMTGSQPDVLTFDLGQNTATPSFTVSTPNPYGQAAIGTHTFSITATDYYETVTADFTLVVETCIEVADPVEPFAFDYRIGSGPQTVAVPSPITLLNADCPIEIEYSFDFGSTPYHIPGTSSFIIDETGAGMIG